MSKLILILGLLLLGSIGFSQKKLFQVKNKIGIGKEIYYVSDKKNQIRNGGYSYNYLNTALVKGQYLNNLKHGNWVYLTLGKYKINAFYNNGVKDSTWTFYENDKIKAVVSFKNGKRHGISTGYYPQGAINSIINYDSGNIIGQRKVFYENGSLLMIANYEKDTLDGDFKYFDTNGETIFHMVYKKNKPFSLEVNEMPDSIKYFSGYLKNGNGKLELYSKDILKNSFYLFAEQEYLNGMLNGRYIEYASNGNTKFEGHYSNELMVGQWFFYNTNNPKIQATRKYFLKDSIKEDSTDLYKVVPSFLSMFQPDLYVFYNENIKWFNEHISRTLKYPSVAQENGISGSIYTNYVIDISGEVLDIKLRNTIDQNLDKEALNVLKVSPCWVPAFVNNIPYRVQFTWPINFILQ